MSESTLPRITSSLASMRWIVGTERPGQLGELSLVDTQEGTRRPQLC